MNFTRTLVGVIAAVSAASAAPVLAADAEPMTPVAIPAPPTGKGQVVFFRPGGFVGSAVACSVWESGQKVSSLGGGRYFVMVAAPGRHEFSVKTEATDKLPLEVEPDETQFASCKIKMGIMVGRPDIRPSSEEEFRAQKNLKLVDDDDMGPGALKSADMAAALAAPPAPPAAPVDAAPAAPAPMIEVPAVPAPSAPAAP